MTNNRPLNPNQALLPPSNQNWQLFKLEWNFRLNFLDEYVMKHSIAQQEKRRKGETETITSFEEGIRGKSFVGSPSSLPWEGEKQEQEEEEKKKKSFNEKHLRASPRKPRPKGE